MKTDRKRARTMTDTTEVATTAPGSPPAVHKDTNFFEDYGNQSTRRNIVGKILKFSKGDYICDDEEVPLGTKYVVLMDQLLIGWIKWWDNKPESQEMGLLVEGFVPMKREQLGDTDKAEWETDASGKPRDPWQFTNYLVLKPVGAKTEEANLLTFPASSQGAVGTVQELCRTYGKAMRQRPDEWPVVEIGARVYDHKEWGRIKAPTLEVVGWEKKAAA